MGKPLRAFISDCGQIYVCHKCTVHFGHENDILSMTFQGQTGIAYLFDKVYNISIDETELDRYMTTGRHIVRSIRCAVCKYLCGWTYVKSFELDQKYKEGKFVIELAYMRQRDNSNIAIPDEYQISPRQMTRLDYFH